jgi:hypothetical protein
MCNLTPDGDKCWAEQLVKGASMSKCLVRKADGTNCTPQKMAGAGAKCLKGVCRREWRQQLP